MTLDEWLSIFGMAVFVTVMSLGAAAIVLHYIFREK